MINIEELQKQIKDSNSKVYIKYLGERRYLFCSTQGNYCINAKGRRNKGRFFEDWGNIEKVYGDTKKETNLVDKFKKKASKATFTNSWIEKIKSADNSKDLYENGITSGCTRDGEVVSLKAIGKKHPFVEEEFRLALKERENYHSSRLDFRGYDMTLELQINGEEVFGWLSLEYRGCGNGHYYNLINDNEFIYVEKD